MVRMMVSHWTQEQATALELGFGREDEDRVVEVWPFRGGQGPRTEAGPSHVESLGETHLHRSDREQAGRWCRGRGGLSMWGAGCQMRGTLKGATGSVEWRRLGRGQAEPGWNERRQQ